MKRVVLIGLDPATVDFSDPALPPGMTAEKIHAGVKLALADSFFDFLRGMHPYWHRDASHAVPFRTVAKRSTGKEGDHEKDGRLRSSILPTRVVPLERSVTLASSVFEFCATQDLNYTTGVFDGVLLPQNTSCAA